MPDVGVSRSLGLGSKVCSNVFAFLGVDMCIRGRQRLMRDVGSMG